MTKMNTISGTGYPIILYPAFAVAKEPLKEAWRTVCIEHVFCGVMQIAH
jgi:hypothetical protein